MAKRVGDNSDALLACRLKSDLQKAESECSRLASRVEELEKVIARINAAYDEMREYGLMSGFGGVDRSFSVGADYLKQFEDVLAGAHAEEKSK